MDRGQGYSRTLARRGSWNSFQLRPTREKKRGDVAFSLSASSSGPTPTTSRTVETDAPPGVFRYVEGDPNSSRTFIWRLKLSNADRLVDIAFSLEDGVVVPVCSPCTNGRNGSFVLHSTAALELLNGQATIGGKASVAGSACRRGPPSRLSPGLPSATLDLAEAPVFRGDVTVFRLDATAEVWSGLESRLRRTTAERVYTSEPAHNPEAAGSNPAPAIGKAPGNGAFRISEKMTAINRRARTQAEPARSRSREARPLSRLTSARSRFARGDDVRAVRPSRLDPPAQHHSP